MRPAMSSSIRSFSTSLQRRRMASMRLSDPGMKLSLMFMVKPTASDILPGEAVEAASAPVGDQDLSLQLDAFAAGLADQAFHAEHHPFLEAALAGIREVRM